MSTLKTSIASQRNQHTHTRAVTLLLSFILAITGLLAVAPAASANTGGYPYAGLNGPGTNPPGSFWADQSGNGVSPNGYYYRNCTDYVAWKLKSLGVADAKVRGLGNGGQWAANAAGRAGVTVSNSPTVGSAAVRLASGSDPYGHVAFVEAVNSNGTITVSEYNWVVNGVPDGSFHQRTATGASMGLTKFIDFGVNGGVNGGLVNSSDIDGNSASDLVLTTSEPGGGSASMALRSTWEGFISPVKWWGDSTVGWAGIKPLVADVNGDKKSDYVFVANSGPGVRIYVALSNGSGFGVPQLWWNGDGYGYQGAKVLLGDVDGNGAADVVFVRPDNGGGIVVNVSLSTWQSYLTPMQWWASTDYGFANVTPILGDVKITIDPVKQKSDGAVDLVLMADFGGGGTRLYVLTSSRSSFIAPVLWWSDSSYVYADLKPVLGDVDGNGASDLVLVRKVSGGNVDVKVALSTWDGFIAMTTWWNLSGIGWTGVTPMVGDVKVTIDPVKQQPDKAADLVFMTNEGAAGTKILVAVSSRSSFVGVQEWWHGVGWGYDGIKPSLS